METNKNRRQQFRELERALEEKFKKDNENQVSLSEEDFKDGKLSFPGFYRLKQQCEHIPIREEIEIVLPEKYAEGVKDTLDRIGAGELSHIKKERNGLMLRALALFLGGMVFLVMGFLLDGSESSYIIKQIVVIASWVFVWAAVEKLFFEQAGLQASRFKMLQILSAKITPQ